MLAPLWKRELGQFSRSTIFRRETMFQSRIAQWSYYLGCVSAAVAIVYRALTLGGVRFLSAPRLIPHNFFDLSILLFVVSIASDARAIHRQRSVI
jgi:hypothetical protein